MDLKDFNEIFEKEISNNKIALNIKEYDKFYTYMKEIIAWNEKINVTAITDEKEFLVKHLIDSLTVNGIVEHGKKIIDIGTGAGFPGIPLKIANPDLEVTLIDSVNKKLNVIRDISGKMNLKNLEIIHTRAEDLGVQKEYREQFDFVTTRAVSRLNTIVEYMLPFVRIGGKAICMKGPNVTDEIEESKKAIEVLGGNITGIEKIVIDNEFERNIVIITKEKSTPKQYPRSKGKPAKEPIR